MGATSPSGVSRPFDARRDGFVMGEGAGALVLEPEEAAKERGAEVLGYLTGYGATADAHHLTAPEASGDGAARAIETALADAGVGPDERASMFLTGPGVVKEVMGEDVSKEELGGPRVHSANGVCQLVAEDDAAASRAARLHATEDGRAGQRERTQGAARRCRAG